MRYRGKSHKQKKAYMLLETCVPKLNSTFHQNGVNKAKNKPTPM